MLARNMVIQRGSQLITLEPFEQNGGYRIIDGAIHILYELQLNREGCSICNWDDDEPVLVSVKADDFLVSQNDHDAERRFVTWATKRAREIVDQKVLGKNWKVRLSDAGHKQYFNIHIESEKPQEVHPKLLHGSHFLWSCFFPHDSEDTREIEAQYQAEAV